MRLVSSRPATTRRVRYVIEADRPWFRVDWTELIAYRDLMLLLFRRDQVARYKQTLLGPAWYVVQPLATAVIFSVVFGRFAGIETEGVPRMLFYLAGLLGWNFFAQSLQATSSVFLSNADLFGKVYFPRLVVPVAALLTTAVTFCIQFLIFLLFLAVHQHVDAGLDYGINMGVLLLPLLALQTAALGLGVGLWLSSLTAKYRDLKHALSFLISSLMFLTPVIYPLSGVPPEFRGLLQLNPMASVVECFRRVLLGAGTVDAATIVVSLAITAVVLMSGILIFKRVEHTVVDTV